MQKKKNRGRKKKNQKLEEDMIERTRRINKAKAKKKELLERLEKKKMEGKPLEWINRKKRLWRDYKEKDKEEVELRDEEKVEIRSNILRAIPEKNPEKSQRK